MFYTLLLKNVRGKYFSVELSGDVYQLYHDLRDNGLNMPPHRIPIKFGTTTLTSASELEKNMIRLFRESDSLDDVVTMLTAVREMREDIRPKFEQWMRSNLYANKDEVYEHIRELKVALANEKLTFYCPLEGNIYNYGMASSFLAEDSVLVDYKSVIEELLEREQTPDCDMAKYVGEQAGIGNRLILAEWKVEEIGDTLYGRIDCYLDGKLDKSELEKLREALIGQNSDGLGESLEQHPIKMDYRDLYVSFWNSKSDYFLKTSDEFEEYLHQQNEMKMQLQ